MIESVIAFSRLEQQLILIELDYGNCRVRSIKSLVLTLHELLSGGAMLLGVGDVRQTLRLSVRRKAANGVVAICGFPTCILVDAQHYAILKIQHHCQALPCLDFDLLIEITSSLTQIQYVLFGLIIKTGYGFL